MPGFAAAAQNCAPSPWRDTVRVLSAPMPRRLPTRALVSLAALVTACNFDAQGLGETTQVDLSVGGSSTSGSPEPGSTGPTPTTGDPLPGSSSGGDESSSGAPVCSDDCPPTPAWTVKVPGEAHALVLDPLAGLVVAGDRPQANNPASTDVWAAKFAVEDGQQLWETRHNGDQKGKDFARDVAFAADGSVVVVGGSQEVMGRRIDLWVGRLAGDTGELVSATNLMTGHWNGDDVRADEWAEGVAIDANGGLALVGSRCPGECEVPDAWIGRFDATGESLWGEPMLPISAGSFRGLLLADDTLWPFGTDGYDGSPSPWRTLIRRLDDDGAGTWSALPDPPGPDQPSVVVVDAALAGDGALWVVGREVGVGAERGFLRCYHPARGDSPVVELHGEALAGSLAAVVLTDEGAPIVAGAAGSDATRHLWLARYTGELALVWRINELAEDVEEARGLARDPDGGLVVVGVSLSDREPPETWLRRYLPVAP